MIFSLVFLFLIILIMCMAMFYLFCFFIPALKVRYTGVSGTLASELSFADSWIDDAPRHFGRKAVISSFDSGNRRLVYKGERNCALFYSVYNSEYDSPDKCIGFGDCVERCPQKAISIQDGRAVVGVLCNGCGACIDACPVSLISLVPAERRGEKCAESEGRVFQFWYSCCRLIKSKRFFGF